MPIKNDAFIEINGKKVALNLSEPGPVDTVHVSMPPKPQLQPVGRCIYCGSSLRLSDEHIIPYGLSGTDVLPLASCLDCAKETSRFEQAVLRGPMRAARIFRKLRSRSKYSEAEKTHRLRVVRVSGEEQEIDLPIGEYPILLHFPLFAQPGLLTGVATPGVQLMGMHTVLFGPHPEEVARQHGARELKFPATKEQPTAFARMLAKIAYGYAVGTGAILRVVGEPTVLNCIRGRADDAGQWVFTDDSATVSYPGLLHRCAFHEMHGLLVAEVQLFADSQTPRYGVILGRTGD